MTNDYVDDLFDLLVWLDKEGYPEKSEVVYYAILHLKKLEEQLGEHGKRMYS